MTSLSPLDALGPAFRRTREVLATRRVGEGGEVKTAQHYPRFFRPALDARDGI